MSHIDYNRVFNTGIEKKLGFEGKKLIMAVKIDYIGNKHRNHNPIFIFSQSQRPKRVAH